MSAPLLVRCPKCRQRVRLRGLEDVGKTIRCSRCGEPFAAQPESEPIPSSEPVNKPVDEMELGRLAFESEIAALNEPKPGETGSPPPARVALSQIKERQASARVLKSTDFKPPNVKPAEPARENSSNRTPKPHRERSTESSARPRPIEEPTKGRAAAPDPVPFEFSEGLADQSHEAGREPALTDQDEPADPFATAAERPHTIDDDLVDQVAELGSPVLLRPRKRRQREAVFVEPRRSRKRKQNPWTINRVAGAVGMLIALVAWAYASYFYINSDSSRIDEKLREEQAAKEAEEDDSLVLPLGANTPEVGSVLVKKPHQHGFFVNAIVQVPNALHVSQWTGRYAPSIVFIVLFLEGLVVYTWLTARRLEHDWGQSEEDE